METNEIAKKAAAIIFDNEGNYGSVNKNDNGAVSVGKLQWHADRAAALLRDIIKKIGEGASSILGGALFRELSGGASWVARIVTQEEADRLKTILTTDAGKAAQDAQAIADVTTYIKKGKSYGLSDTGALIYFADGVNQYGTASALWKTITVEALKGAGDVSAMYEATKKHTNKYLTRRKVVYEKVTAMFQREGNMTEQQVRQKAVSTAQAWLGCKESNGTHKQIIDLYNSVKPLPRGYAVKYTDAWCATYISAVGIAAGMSGIIFRECGCGAMIELYKAAGRWQENDGYVPKKGDIIFYDWEDTGKGDNTGYPDHEGMICEVFGNKLHIIEGNKNNAVEYRDIEVNSRYIRGYGLPDYASMAAAEPEKTPDKKTVAEIAKEVYAGKWGNGADRKARLEAAGYNYAEVQAAVNTIAKVGSDSVPVLYTVKAGDTLSAIAKKYNTTVDALVKLNGIKNKDLIHTGQVIKIK